jgi:hypothetical protein
MNVSTLDPADARDATDIGIVHAGVGSESGAWASCTSFLEAFVEVMDVISRYVPIEVRRAVWVRDEGCCSFVGSTGHRCRSTYQVEFDHAVAFARGGESTVDNVRLLCRQHNLFEAERVFGKNFMRKFAALGKQTGRATTAKATSALANPPDRLDADRLDADRVNISTQ